MKLKLLLDEDVHFSLASVLRKRGFDVIHVQELDRKGMTDQEQLDYAVMKKSCIFSFNIKDYVILHNNYAANGADHWGIIVAKQSSFKETLNRLLPVLQQNIQESLKNKLEFI